MDDLRVGTAFDAHRLVLGRPLVLGGVRIESDLGLDGHSDADIVCHALIDAMFGAASLDDIGTHFPPEDPRWQDASSLELLRLGSQIVREQGWALVNCDAFLVLQRPKIADHRPQMRANVADAIGCALDRVSIRATTTDGLGFVGRREGASCHAVALLRR